MPHDSRRRVTALEGLAMQHVHQRVLEAAEQLRKHERPVQKAYIFLASHLIFNTSGALSSDIFCNLSNHALPVQTPRKFRAKRSKPGPFTRRVKPLPGSSGVICSEVAGPRSCVGRIGGSARLLLKCAGQQTIECESGLECERQQRQKRKIKGGGGAFTRQVGFGPGHGVRTCAPRISCSHAWTSAAFQARTRQVDSARAAAGCASEVRVACSAGRSFEWAYVRIAAESARARPTKTWRSRRRQRAAGSRGRRSSSQTRQT
eukprot:6196455-Pleurochrysis_carterae.AAC.2